MRNLNFLRELYTVKVNRLIELLSGYCSCGVLDGSPRWYTCMYIAGITRYLELPLLLILATKETKPLCYSSNCILISDNVTGARKLASIATYFQLGKPVTGTVIR